MKSKEAVRWILCFSVIGVVIAFLYLRNASNTDSSEIILAYVLGVFGLPVFFTPFLVSVYNKYSLKYAVFAANIILGWTGLGWAAVLFFSISVKSTG